MSAVVPQTRINDKNPQLVFSISSFDSEVNEAVFITGKDAILTAGSDRSLRIWIKRTNDKFWPSAMEVLPSPISCMMYCSNIGRIFGGLDNGTVVEYTLSDDLNYLEHKRDYLSHMARVTGVVYSDSMKWIASCSKDRSVTFSSTENGKPVGNYKLESAATCIAYDPSSHNVFVGDSSGHIFILNYDVLNGGCRLLRELCGHAHAVTSFSWDSCSSRLFSSSSDESVVMWDLRSSKGLVYELKGHSSTVTSVCWWPKGNSKNAPENHKEDYTGLAISSDLNGVLMFWYMNPSRVTCPTWSESDVCMLCTAPFYWNVKKMWDLKSAGVRQHHCRRCGRAVCDKCSMFRSTLPAMGFELEIRMCNSCSPNITETDHHPLAKKLEANSPITSLQLEPNQNLILAVCKDRTVKVWDIECLM